MVAAPYSRGPVRATHRRRRQRRRGHSAGSDRRRGIAGGYPGRIAALSRRGGQFAACRMILAIDAGNSRLKWGLHSAQSGWYASGALALQELERLYDDWT